VKCPLCDKRVSKRNLSEHKKVHQRWRTPTKCDICRKHFSYDNFTRHMLTHYSFDKFALTRDKDSGGDYPLVFKLKEPRQYKSKEPGPKSVVHFDWKVGDRDVAPYEQTLWYG
jgi:CRISPR/Cas system-associated protein Cas10 (large subunit of type III CRISPR-Cas system)